MTSTSIDPESEPDDRLKYLRNGELRREIVEALGKSDTRRYGTASDRGLTKEHVRAIALAVGDHEEPHRILDMELTQLYTFIGEAVGTEHIPNSGQDWGFTRKLLKAIHREIVDEDDFDG